MEVIVMEVSHLIVKLVRRLFVEPVAIRQVSLVKLRIVQQLQQ